MRVTIKDIAERLNINKSTVSYALNGKGVVKPQTRELIRNIAREMGYVPSQSARQTSTGKSNEVAIVVPNVISIYGEFCEYAFHQLSDKGMRSSISISEFSEEREETIIQDLIGKGVAGILIASSLEFDSNQKHTYIKSLLHKHGIPVVYRSETTSHSSVGIDFRSVGRMMGEKLVASGRKRICIAAPHPPPLFNNIYHTLEGKRGVMGEKADIRIEFLDNSERNEVSGNFGLMVRQMLTEAWYDCHRKLFHKIWNCEAERPDAIVSPTDTCIMAIKHEAEKCGIGIPGELSLIAGTRSVSSYLSQDDITSAYVPEKRIAESMVDMLMRKIEKNEKFESVHLSPDFYAGSTL